MVSVGSREEVFNTVLTGTLDRVRPNWQVWGLASGVLKSRCQPDIIMQEKGASSVIIETKFYPTSTLDTDMRQKLNQMDSQERDVTTVIGVTVPTICPS